MARKLQEVEEDKPPIANTKIEMCSKVATHSKTQACFFQKTILGGVAQAFHQAVNGFNGLKWKKTPNKTLHWPQC